MLHRLVSSNIIPFYRYMLFRVTLPGLTAVFCHMLSHLTASLCCTAFHLVLLLGAVILRITASFHYVTYYRFIMLSIAALHRYVSKTYPF